LRTLTSIIIIAIASLCGCDEQVFSPTK